MTESIKQYIYVKQIYGVNSNILNNIQFKDDKNLIYIAGKNIVIENVVPSEKSAQKIIPINNTTSSIKSNLLSTGITAIALSPNKKYLVIAEKGEIPWLSLFDISIPKKKKPIRIEDIGSKEYVSVTFSNDGKYLIALGGAPEYKIVVFSMEGKAKPVITISNIFNLQKEPIYNISMSPDNKYLSVIGEGVFKLFKIEDNSAKITNTILPNSNKKERKEKYLSQCWVSKNRLIISNDTGELYFIENSDFVCVLPCSPSDGLSINTIIPYKNGFICGGENGVVSFFESSNDKEYYKRYLNLKLDPDQAVDSDNSNEAKITDFCLNPTNEILGLITNFGQIYYLNLINDITKEEEIHFELLNLPFHSHTITGMDICACKPLIATCSSDKSIKIINYLDPKLTFAKLFPSEPLSISIHPTGYFLLISFADNIRFYSIKGNEDLIEKKSFHVRNSNLVKFSNGGHLFCVINGNVINIYSTYSLKPISLLHGHSNKINAICWSEDDTKIVSSGSDGLILEFGVFSEKKIADIQFKQCNLSSILYNETEEDLKHIISSGSDKSLRNILDNQVTSLLEIDDIISSLAISKKTKFLFSGNENGSISIFSITGSTFDHEQTLYTNCDEISKISISDDDGLLMSISKDGTLIIYEIKDKDGNKSKAELKFSEDILLPISDIEEKNSTINDLKTKISELKSDSDYDQRKKEMLFNDKLREQESSFKEEINKQKENILNLVNEKEEILKNFNEEKQKREKEFKEKLSKLEHEYNQRISATMEKIIQLKKEKEDELNSMKAQSKSESEVHKNEIAELIEQRQEDIRKEKENSQKEKISYENEIKEYKEKIKQIEEDRDKEIEEIKHEYEEKLKQAQSIEFNLKGQNTILEKKEMKLSGEIDEYQKQVEQLKKKIKENKNKIDSLEKEKQGLKKEKKQGEDTIVDKEKKLFELKKQNQELEKFKFVLDYKINMLTEQIKPSKDQIENLRNKLKDLDKELEKSKNINKSQDSSIKNLELKNKGLIEEISKLNSKIKRIVTFKKRIRSDLSDVIQKIQEPKDLKENVVKLYNKYVTKSVKKNKIDYNVEKEYERQRKYLEETVKSLKKRLVKSNETTKTENLRIMNENILLINEINQLRKEVRLLKTKLKEKDDKRSVKTASSKKENDLNEDQDSNIFLNDNSNFEELKKENEIQKIEISTLKEKIEELNYQMEKIKEKEKVISSEESKKDEIDQNRPISREKLPPII